MKPVRLIQHLQLGTSWPVCVKDEVGCNFHASTFPRPHTRRVSNSLSYSLSEHRKDALDFLMVLHLNISCWSELICQNVLNQNFPQVFVLRKTLGGFWNSSFDRIRLSGKINVWHSERLKGNVKKMLWWSQDQQPGDNFLAKCEIRGCSHFTTTWTNHINDVHKISLMPPH